MIYDRYIYNYSIYYSIKQKMYTIIQNKIQQRCENQSIYCQKSGLLMKLKGIWNFQTMHEPQINLQYINISMDLFYHQIYFIIKYLQGSATKMKKSNSLIQSHEENANMHQSIDSYQKAFSSSELLNLLQRLLSSFAQSIRSHHSSFELHSFSQQLNPKTLRYSLVPKQKFTLTTASLSKLMRLLEICMICIDNIKSGKYITKRNLFYKLDEHYQSYKTIDTDLRTVCQNLYYIWISSSSELRKQISRADLGVVPSNRCIMFGRIQVIADGCTVSKDSQQNLQIITLPTCRKVQVVCKAKTVIIVQKQSFFYEVINMIKQLKLSDRYVVISAKGYPDQNTRTLLSQICEQKNPQIINILYLGDYDVFGFDIFWFYCFGDWNCKGLLPKLQLLQLSDHFQTEFQTELANMMSKFSKQDTNKIKEIINKVDALLLKKQQFSQKIRFKIQKLKEYFQIFAAKNKKCELELLWEMALQPFWIYKIIAKAQKL